MTEYCKKTDPVSIISLSEYTYDTARAALERMLCSIGGLDFLTEGAKVVIKANLVSAMKPETAATTHPILLSALCDILTERGAEVVIGDSPGGLYNAAYVGRVYNHTGVRECEAHGARLNDNFSQSEALFPEGKVLHNFTYTSYLDECDFIINFSKLKSHGMMNMSSAVKNMFGAVPGVIKPEYHYRFPTYEDFADMLVDLNEYFKPALCISDAVVGMEGNGPTAGTPKEMGFLLASHSPYNLDLLAAELLGFSPSEVPTVAAAIKRGYCPETVTELDVVGSYKELAVTDFERVVSTRSLEFSSASKNVLRRMGGAIAKRILRTRPSLVKSMCVGCGVCKNICPAKAIVIEKGKAKINRKKCIRCFCCQEFCPKSALKVRHTALASLFHKEKTKKN